MRAWRWRLPALAAANARLRAARRQIARTTLRGWRAVTRGATLRDSRAIDACFRSRRRVLHDAFLQWRIDGTVWRGLQALVRRQVQGTNPRRVCARAVHTWRLQIALGCGRRAVLQRRRRVAKRTLAAWHHAAARQQRSAALSAHALASSRRSKPIALLQRWRRSAQRRSLGRRYLLSLTRAHSARALRTWKAACFVRVRSAALRLAAVGHHRQHAAVAWQTWTQWMSLASQLGSLYGLATTHTARRMLRAWHVRAVERHLGVALAFGSARRAAALACTTALAVWQRVAGAGRRRRSALSRMARLRVLGAMAQWRRTADALASSPEEQLTALLLGGRDERAVRTGFGHWAGWSRAASHARRGGKRALGFLLHRAVAPAFTSWLAAWRHSRRQLQIAERARRAFHGALGRSWFTWFEAARARREALGTARRAFHRWQSQAMLSIFLLWAQVCAVAAAHRRSLLSALAALRQDARRRAMRSWSEYASSKAAREQRQRRVAIALLGSGLLRAWNTLQERTAEGVAARDRARAAIIALCSRALVVAWRSWAGLCVDPRVAALRTLLDPAAKQKRRAWNSMRQAASQRALAVRAARRMRSLGTARALRSWTLAVEQRRSARKALAALVYRLRALAFRTWAARRGERVATRGVARQAIRRLRSLERAKALSTWHAAAQWRRWLLWRPAARFRQHTAGLAMATWRDAVAQRASACKLMAWVGSRLIGRHQMRVLARWRAAAARHWLKEAQLQRAVAYWGWSGCAEALGWWLQRSKGGAHNRALVQRALLAFGLCGARGAWCVWRQMLAVRAAALAQGRAALLALRRHVSGRLLRTWRVHAQIARLMVIGLADADGAARKRLLQDAFRRLSLRRRPSSAVHAALHAAVEPLRRAYGFWALEARAQSRFYANRRTKAIAAARYWCVWAAETLRLRVAARGVLARCRSLTLHTSFARWAVGVSALSRALAAAVRGARHDRHTTLRAALVTIRAWLTAVLVTGMLQGRSRRASRALLFRRWRDWLAARSAALTVLGRSGRHWKAGALGMCYRTWRSVSVARRIATAACHRVLSLDRKRALAAWREDCRRRTRRAEAMQRAARALRRARLRAAWPSLISAVETASKAVKLRKLCAAHAVLGGGLCVLRYWRRRTAAAASRARRTAQLWSGGARLASAAWRAWAAEARAYRAAATLLTTGCKAVLRREGVRRMRWWRRAAADWVALRRSLAHWGCRQLACGWRALRAHHLSLQRLMAATAALGGMGVQKRLLWRLWRNMARDRGGHVRKARFAANLIRGRMETGCFATWAAVWRSQRGERTRLRDSTRRGLQSMQNAQLRRALNTMLWSWRTWRLVRKTANALLHRHGRAALNSWRAAFASARAKLQCMRKAVSALRHGALLRSLNSWSEAAAASATARRRLASAASEWSGGRRRAAWATWCDLVVERRALTRAAQAMRTPAVRRALFTWEAVTLQMQASLRQLRRAAGSLRANGLGRALNQWMHVATAAATAHQRLRSAAREWAGGRLRACWYSWLELLAERRTIARAAGGLIAPGLRQAMTSWAAMSAATQLARRACSRLRHSALLRAYNAWRERCAVEREDSRMRMWAARRIAADPVAIAVDVWRRHATQIMALRARVTRMQPHVRMAHAALDRWQDYAAAWRRTVAFGRRWLEQAKAKALRTWVDASIRWRSVRHLALRVLRAGSARALRQWRLQSREHLRIKALAVRMLGWESAQAFDLWRSVTARHAHLLAKVRRAASFFAGDGCARALQSWRAITSVNGAAIKAIHHALGAWQQRGVSRAFLSLVDHAVSRREALQSARRSLAHLRHGALGRAFRTWAHTAERCARLLRLGSRIGRTAEVQAFNTWRAAAAEHSRQLAAARYAADLLSGRGVVQAFNTWRAAAAEHSRQLAAARYAADLLSGRGVAPALVKWRVGLARQRVSALLLARWLLRLQAISFRTWHSALLTRMTPRRASGEASRLMAEALRLRRGWLALRRFASEVGSVLSDLDWRMAHTWRESQNAHCSIMTWRGARHAFANWRRASLASALSCVATACADDHATLAASRRGFRYWRGVVVNGARLEVERTERLLMLWRGLQRWSRHGRADSDAHMRIACANRRFLENMLYMPLRWWRYRTLANAALDGRRPVRLAPSPSVEVWSN